MNNSAETSLNITLIPKRNQGLYICKIYFSELLKIKDFESRFSKFQVNSADCNLEPINGFKYQTLRELRPEEYSIYYFENTPRAYVRMMQLAGSLPKIETYLVFDIKKQEDEK